MRSIQLFDETYFLTPCQEECCSVCMKTFAVGEFKARFSEIVERVRAGDEIIISYGKKKENVAVLIPYAAYKTKKIRLGLLQDKSLKIQDDFKMSEEELLGL